MKALIFAAGKGTRLKPFTDFHPKALVPVNGIPLLERNIKFLQAFGIHEFVINIHHFGEQIKAFLDQHHNFGAKIDFSDEKESLLETGGGMLFAQKFLENEPEFLVMNADILTNLDVSALVNFHKKHGQMISLAVSDRKSSRKLLFDENMVLRGWKNSSTGETRSTDFSMALQEFAFSGVHCVSSSFFNHIKRRGAFSIMEEYLDLMETQSIMGFLHHHLLIDVGRPESVLEAEKHFK